MQATDPLAPSSGVPPPDVVRAAFQDVHGTRLHGFALLLTLGDRIHGALVASQALADGGERSGELRHPERAAAWLRQRVLRQMRNRRHTPPGSPRDRSLEELGADACVIGALGELRVRERAALIASDIEGLDQRDVGTIVGIDGAAMERLLRRARLRYADAFAAIAGDGGDVDGPLSKRIRAESARGIA
ncbi:MAG: sigma factor-like helix-turn-helix DNA-binding protein [Candidatus Limnocylindria bacterium]